jgi:quercetin dioxygenase-like cupin family protein
VEPVVLGPGEGETVTDEPESFVQIKAGSDELALTESRYAPGESGPGPHIHREHVDAFWVLDGELVFELGAGERVMAPAETFVLVPPEVVHTFRNEGPGDARFLNIHAPSRDFHRQLRGEDVDFDTEDPPADGGRPASGVVLRRSGEGKALAMGPARAVIKAGQDDGGGRLALMDTRLEPGFPGPVAHRHRRMVDSFYVLEGELSVTLGDSTQQVTPGTYVVIPPGAVHTFSNRSSGPVRAVNLMVPGGLERYLEEVAAALQPGRPMDPELMARIASRYDFEPV